MLVPCEGLPGHHALRDGTGVGSTSLTTDLAGVHQISISFAVINVYFMSRHNTVWHLINARLSSLMSVGNRNVTVQVLPAPFCVAGLKAGDEIVEINKKAAEDLDSALLKDALVQPSLCLTVRTYPEIEEGQKLMQPPPRRLENPSDLSDGTLAFAGSNQGIWFDVEITRRRIHTYNVLV